jgi:hypothetical protein
VARSTAAPTDDRQVTAIGRDAFAPVAPGGTAHHGIAHKHGPRCPESP